MTDPDAFLRDLFETAVAAVSAETVLPACLPSDAAKGCTIVVGCGKAAAAMARVAERHLGGRVEGAVVTRYGHSVEPAPETIAVMAAGHPSPDANSVQAAERMRDLALDAGADDRVLALISGGGSALMALPAAGLSLGDKVAVSKALMAAGADISEINSVRKHLSAIKGGRLAEAAAPATVVACLISDVAGDDPAAVSSGPTVADPTTLKDARAVLKRYGIAVSSSVRKALGDAENETPKRLDPPPEVRMAATARTALDAAASRAAKAGLAVLDLGDRVEGDSAEVAQAHAKMALAVERPALILSGGETTVALASEAAEDNRGGPNLVYAAELALALDGAPNIHAVACDTDGIDGTSRAAGALVGPDFTARLRACGVDARALLAKGASEALCGVGGVLVTPGPTRTNVNDFRAVLALPQC